jgi:6,7-dimethyl-8-ribityllumazine synthase
MLTPLPARPRLATTATNRIAIVASRYNKEFVDPMVEKALSEISTIEALSKTEVFYAPGSFEIPYLTRQVIEKNRADAVICLGVIFRGETGHADLIAASVSNSLCNMSVETGTAIIHGVLLLDNESQARERCLGTEFNRGTEAARAAIEVLRASTAITTT